ncbi:sugar ABC transporter ATP-binding protein [Paenibacillus barengoltzii]|jgi:inositol transport system ATP-binding protein|uniref:sugar ABC transporter ATP-binding protein n=1 Tax=Paenibacillus barengoltzii TaxID=343517 RepID=UPI000A084D45|nr:sugar ABC transporter ATP-binding protein [Paenibacillus barengoltzii]MEC2342561.1 sugar ABC transporter ATP-binding protein [Paenibacillus barengoltzii]SMF00043.1 monosaccharide ABC transporter ATP-binding protein, CUT2 family (TC 3.A.1.2.-) [Paenibacillus barengoltzii]
MGEPIKLRVSQIEKSFPGVKALNKIDFSVKKGTVHVLCGENGAGKSTLMKIINGVYQPDAGEIYLDGKLVKIGSPLQARQLGISMIFQELNYVAEMSVEENLFLGRLPVNRLGKVNWKEVTRQTLQLLQAEQLPYDPKTLLKDLTVSDIQMLEIMKAVSNQAELIIMDEPTSAITQKEVDRLFAKIRELKARGVSIIYISHKLDEIFQIADEITVFRDGTVVDSRPKEELDIETVINLMVGRQLKDTYPKVKAAIGEEILRVDGLSRNGVFRDVSFCARRGEIIGFAGLMGAGRTEVMRSLFGLDPLTSGTIRIKDEDVTKPTVQGSLEKGMVMLSEDRRRYGIIPVRSVRENTTLSVLGQVFYGLRHRPKREQELVKGMFDKMRVKTPSLETPIASLSGGNQQKVLLSRWMLLQPDILILDEPTRGIDVGAKYEIYKLIGELAEQGKAILMVSSELPELIGMCDRIYVMAQGQVTGELGREDFSQETIMRYATGMMTSEVK